ncbi:TonB-dependent receptor, Outer membrane receptor for ferrienterochelin and colicins [Methylophaga frappieri]|uniref:TonB-dependent receptor, Outer membrane receptor for ferrienterochelin and colicins n=1 Tax=Methylophaga frappieri (strain ATCC BAA-2434 / DSM 25690 / JAM7) TaxID=754477 RepID=I1YHC8_METFJ|nr:FepA family TonB-dependent siderophore receptor [Methylophaga frappieri]AFJ02321.1 TonB-dependent receptor, Outer membrane receptor for ferrienterochelin and colicins [Methylophaga frappieri]
MFHTLKKKPLSLSITGAIFALGAAYPAFAEDETDVELDTIVVKTAKEELQQSPGLSVITSEVLEKQPVANDISEIVRKMPGVNLSGSSASGQRGNQRQIDIRGMGPDNTLILIDGRPVTARNSVRPGRAGESDSRGDSQWVPPSAIERIEVLRGPAAARYGSGSMGGVVNIITKAPTRKEFSVTGHYELPESDLEGSSWRTNVNLSGPITDKLSARTTLGYHESEGDDPFINEDYANNGSLAAGREGVENIDLRQLFEYAIDSMNRIGAEFNYSQQENRWAGDSQFQSIRQSLVDELEGETTNELRRYGMALTHKGDYENSRSNSYIEYNRTNNRRLSEGVNGGGEGQINDTTAWNTSVYETLNAKSEWDMFFDRHTLTSGIEFRGERLDNGIIDVQSSSPIGVGVDPVGSRDPESDAYLVGVYVEDNYELNPDWYITPGVRLDYHSEGGNNWSPSLNSTYYFNENWSVKGGVSRAFKAPNLYQLDPNYIYNTRGNGCPEGIPGPCNMLGNPNLDNETSWNKEITINYANNSGFNSGLTYYHNDFDNRVAAGTDLLTVDPEGRKIFRWENQGEAIVEGVEGFVQVPVTENISWYTNLTYNIRSESKETGEPLSLIPEYTINSNLGWDITPNLHFNYNISYYGKIEAPERSVTTGDPLDLDQLIDRDPYAISNVNLRYEVTNKLALGFGVKNLFDKKIMREGTSNNAGANTYNELGRTYMVDAQYNF